MNDKPPAYTFQNDFERSSAAIPTISGGTEAYNRRNPGGTKRQVDDGRNTKSKRPIETDPNLCTDLMSILRSN